MVKIINNPIRKWAKNHRDILQNSIHGCQISTEKMFSDTNH